MDGSLSWLGAAVDDAAYRVRSLRRAALVTVTLTIVNLTLLVSANLVALYEDRRSAFTSVDIRLTYTLVHSAAATFALIAVAYFDLLRRRTDGVVEELTRALETVLNSRDRGSEDLLEDGVLTLKLRLRDLRAASELPFAPGQRGSTFYLIGNLIFVIVGSYLVRV